MLPLVRQIDRRWTAGWCTYTDGFDQNPDIEIFCGGENEKRALAAACWRQGNLLHFGFEQSPAELNETGQKLLLNCIAYVSGFTQDRPIAVTPSVFAGPVGYPRTYLDRRLGESGEVSDCGFILSDALMKALASLKPDEVKAWYSNNRGYLHPGPGSKLEIDLDAEALRVPIDEMALFDKALASLAESQEQPRRVSRLLKRYAPPDTVTFQSSEEWKQWLKANRPFLFFSDQGDYRWYVDPLAKERGVPSSQLRGPARASIP